MHNKLKPGYVSILAVITLTSVMLLMLAASFRFSIQSQESQKKTQVRIDYAHREQAILRSVLNIAPNRAMRAMMGGSSRNPVKNRLRFRWIFQDAMERADAEAAVSADVAGVLGLGGSRISGNTADANYGHSRTIVGPLGSGLSSGFYVTPGINGVTSALPNLPQTLTVNNFSAAAMDTRWPIITTEKHYADTNSQYKSLPYPNVHFGYTGQGQTFVAKRNWWGFSIKFGAEDVGSSNVATVRKNYVISIYEVPSQLALGSTAMTFIGQFADGSNWSDATISIQGGVFASRATTQGTFGIDRIGTKAGATITGSSSVGGVGLDAISGLAQTREEYEAANPGFFPLSSSSDSGLVAFIPINRGDDAFDDLSDTTDVNRLSPTGWNEYSRPAMQCRMKLRVEDVFSASNQTPTRISFTFKKPGNLEDTLFFTRGVNWPTEDSTEGATFPFHLERTESGREAIAVYVGRLKQFLDDQGGEPLSINNSILVNSNYRDNINVMRPNIPSLTSDLSLIFRDAKDLTPFVNGFSLVTPFRMYFANDVNLVPSGVDLAGLPVYPPVSIFAPEKRFGVREQAVGIDFKGQLNYLNKDSSAQVRPLDLISGVDDEVIASNIRAKLYSIADPDQLPPISQMNWLVVIEEVR